MKTPSSGRLSPAAEPFDPARIERFYLFQCSHRFAGDHEETPDRRFVCLGHKEGRVASIKATSRLSFYLNSPQLLPGVVFYKAGEIALFAKDTIIDPHSRELIKHYDLKRQHPTGMAKVLGPLPEDFPERLANAVRACYRLSSVEQRRLLDLLGM